MIGHRVLILAFVAFLSGCQSEPGQPAPAPAKPAQAFQPVKMQPIQVRPLKFSDVIRGGDRVVFVGDDLTQQMYYTRGIASALLGMKPGDGLRFFNGGWDGATAGAACEWVEDLLSACKPTVVFLCFGLNDGKMLPPDDKVIGEYEENLRRLIDKCKAYPGVRTIVVMSSPAVQNGPGPDENAGGYNQTLRRMAYSAQSVAGVKGVLFVDTFDPMRVLYAEASRIRGDGLAAGRLPTEDGGIVLASTILWAIGVTREELEPVGWAPLKPRNMGRVRPALGIELKEPEYRDAYHSRELYEKLRESDAAFFQAWRLSRQNPRARPRDEMMAKADASWFEVETFVRRAYAGVRGAPVAPPPAPASPAPAPSDAPKPAAAE